MLIWGASVRMTVCVFYTTCMHANSQYNVIYVFPGTVCVVMPLCHSMQITASCAAEKDGRLTVGQRLIEVNGVTMLGASHSDAVNALRSVPNNVKLLVCDGYDPREVLRKKKIAEIERGMQNFKCWVIIIMCGGGVCKGLIDDYICGYKGLI